MKKNLKLVAFSAILLMFAGSFFSCNNKEELFLTVDETLITATAEAGTYSIAVKSNAAWTAVVEDADWCTLNNSTGSGDAVITVNVAKNTLYIARSATIKITSGSLTKYVVINQNAAEEPEVEPFLIVDETPITATAEAGTYSIAVSCNSEWSASVENADWCTLENNTGSGDGVITVNIAENTDYTPRSTTVKITSGSLTKSVVINQNAAEEPEEDPLIVDKTFITATATAGTYSIAVSCNDDWTAVVENADWCTLENNTGSGDGVITVNIAENTGYFMRGTVITITSGGLTKTVSVSQNNAECTECPSIEHSVWKYTDANAIIEVTFYPSINLMQMKTTPENLPTPPYLFFDGLNIEYRITDNKMYWRIVNGEFSPHFYWHLSYPSENEMVMTFGGNFPPFPLYNYVKVYHFVCQTEFNEL